MSPILEWALKYLKHGWSVIPIGAEKKPLVEWKKYQTERANEEQLKKWFDVATPPNIGIVTGKISNLTVVDVEKGGNWADLPVTMTAKTGGGGYHLFYKYAQGVANSVRIRPLTDIRGDGGYCFTEGHKIAVAPKSKYYKSTKSVKIENLRVGDEVMTFNENTSKIEKKKIVKIGKRMVDRTNIIKFGSRQGSLRCTDEHPIFTTKGWVEAGKIKTGDELLHFNREQLFFGKGGHQFKKGIQNRITKNEKNYKNIYKQKKPNHFKRKSKYEEFFSSLVEKENLPIDYVGDGSLIIASEGRFLHPDFVVRGKKKVIEIHIDFHSPNGEGNINSLKNKTQEEKKKMYENQGWECLLINATDWQSFNKNTIDIINEVKNRIIKYVCNGKKIEFNHEVYEDVFVYNIEVEDNHNYFIASREENKKDWYLVHNCVVTPSLHKSGHKYEWTRKEDEQPFPFQFFKLQPKENNDWKKILDGVGNGERNQSATKAIGKILNAVNPKDWSTTAWEMFVIWNQRNNPPLGERELRSVFNSIVGIAVRKGQAKNVETNEDDCDIKLISDIAKNLTDDMTVSYPTGFKKFDEAFMGGLKEGDLMFVTGYSGMGKTLYAQSMTYNLVKNGQPCLWFSFEVSLGELWRKFKDMGVDDNFSAYSPEKTTIRKLDWVHEKIIDSRDRFKTKVIFVDHLGFLSEEPKNYDGNLSSNYATILTMVCRRLKTIAIAENVAVVLLGHLRKPTNGASNDPTFHDIKDSSGVAQESDAVIIINRERTSKGYENEEVYSATTTVKIEKNRRTGTTKKFSVKIDQGRLRDEDEVIFKDFTNLKLPQ